MGIYYIESDLKKKIVKPSKRQEGMFSEHEVISKNNTIENGHRKIRQIDIRSYSAEHTLAFLWQDGSKKWHWTNAAGEVEDIDVDHIDQKIVEAISKEFAKTVLETLNGKTKYLKEVVRGDDQKKVGIQ